MASEIKKLQIRRNKANSIIKDIDLALAGKEDQAITRTTRNKRDRKKTTSSTTITAQDVIKLKDICSQLGIEPGKARRMLRKHEDELKPEGKWEWDKTKHQRIIDKVNKLLKGEAI
jgi:hypothetical protein